METLEPPLEVTGMPHSGHRCPGHCQEDCVLVAMLTVTNYLYDSQQDTLLLLWASVSLSVKKKKKKKVIAGKLVMLNKC